MSSGLRALLLLFISSWLTAVGPQHMPAPSDASSAADRAASWQQHERMRLQSPFARLPWLAVGPRMQGGRVEAITVDPRDPATMYVGAGAGNLWKTSNQGTSWRPIFERQATFSIGDVTLAPSDPDVVWVGTGEVLMARSSFAGNGVYRSRDGGDSWQHLGLDDTHHIARVLVHPDDPDTAWVAAIGHLFSPNDERGVFRTSDGGASWQRTLFIDEWTGAIDLVADPRDPDVLYAAMWEHSRRAWGHVASGPGSGIFRSADGGLSWNRLGEGFPDGEHVGRIGLAVAPSAPDVVYALLDNHQPVEPDAEGRRGPRGEVYRSDDAGAHWRKVSERSIPAGYDFCLIRVAPDDPERVWVPGQLTWESVDGGRTFTELGGTVVHLLDHEATVLHLDQHEMWVDPDNADHWVLGNDGGVYVTWDAAATWLHLNNLPLAEFYAINLDNERPFRIFGGTQDDAALYGPSNQGISDGSEDPWRHVYIDPWGGGDSYFTPPHPVQPWIVFYEHQFGDLRRKDLRDGSTEAIRPRAENIRLEEGEPEPPPLRNNWMTPFFISGYDPDTLYYGTQLLLRSRDRGDSWHVMSPDLTTDPGPERQGNVPFGTLTSVSESPLDADLLWTGSDDGQVHLTRNGGESWQNVTTGLPDKWVSRVVASAAEPERAYVTLTGYRDDDSRPYVFVTEDFGASWRSIAAGLPMESVNVLREDTADPSILYVGTDLGAYVSLDAGASWLSLVADLPTTPVHDLRVHARDGKLVAGTHGRGAFVLDLDPVRAQAAGPGALMLLEPEPVVRPRGRQPAPYREGARSGHARLVWSQAEASTVQVRVVAADGQLVRSWTVEGAAGWQVLDWDLLAEGVSMPTGAFAGRPEYVAPGAYTVDVQRDGRRVSAPLVIVDP